MANSVLPEELMLCILTRLPVKTIIRFKSVCKPWYDLFSTSEFKKLHQAQFSSDPENQSYIVHSFDRHSSEPKNQFYIFNIESPTILDHPFVHEQYIELYTVGCCNGLVCISSGQEIVLWNPAMKLSKTVPLKDCRPFKIVSLGFGYDAIEDDFKVVMLVGNIVYGEGMNITSVEIYSVNLGFWITVDVGFHFIWFPTKNDLIVNGNPCWVAWLDDDNQVLVCFDVLELVLKILPLPDEEAGTEVDLDEETETKTEVDLDEDTETKIWTEKEGNLTLFDWNGALGALSIDYEIECRVGPGAEFTRCCARIECAEVWVFDDIEGIWRNDHSFGPIEVGVDSVIHCTKNEKVLGTLSFDTLFMLDLKTECVKELFDSSACLGYSFEVYGYTESLANISGMQNWSN
ncbi:hypothetical protein CASFOL_013264 [Castilleja foliolosa]|uniref:F-box domain-containing protein n=1 Tax=Castilleja foliolosa TaxID=1961234 RepID=A0ABD3DKS7_9LAMI